MAEELQYCNSREHMVFREFFQSKNARRMDSCLWDYSVPWSGCQAAGRLGAGAHSLGRVLVQIWQVNCGLQWPQIRFPGIEETSNGIHCRKRHGGLNRKKHRNEKPFRRWIYKNTKSIIYFTGSFAAFFATTKIGRRNQENGWEPQGFARTARRPWNALALMVTLWQGRPAKLQSTLTRSLASVDRKWIKTLRLQSNGTKSCDFLNDIKGIIFTQTFTPDIQLEFHFYTASKALDIYI